MNIFSWYAPLESVQASNILLSLFFAQSHLHFLLQIRLQPSITLLVYHPWPITYHRLSCILLSLFTCLLFLELPHFQFFLHLVHEKLPLEIRHTVILYFLFFLLQFLLHEGKRRILVVWGENWGTLRVHVGGEIGAVALELRGAGADVFNWIQLLHNY